MYMHLEKVTLSQPWWWGGLVSSHRLTGTNLNWWNNREDNAQVTRRLIIYFSVMKKLTHGLNHVGRSRLPGWDLTDPSML